MSSLKNISRSSIHFWIYYASLCLLVVALPSSKYFITIALLLLLVNWIAEGRFRHKFRLFFSDRPAVAFVLIYFIYLFGLLWSADFNIALNYDLLHKSPTLFMPLIIASSKVPDRKKVISLLLLFLTSLLIVTIIGLVSRLLTIDIDNTWRKGSPFMPGIYFGIMLVLGAFQLPELLGKITDKKYILLTGFLISAWLVFYLFFIRALSGIASLSAVAVYMVYIFIVRLRSVWMKLVSIGFFILAVVFILYPLKDIYKQTHSEVYTDLSALDEFTSSGNPYFHDRGRIIRENGNLVYIYISDSELAEEWNKRSDLDYNGLDYRGWDLKHTLYRYMASKGLRKDRDGFAKLSDDDLRAVEEGIANYLNVKRTGIYIRAYEEMMGMYIYKKSSYKSPTWGSLLKELIRGRLRCLPLRRNRS